MRRIWYLALVVAVAAAAWATIRYVPGASEAIARLTSRSGTQQAGAKGAPPPVKVVTRQTWQADFTIRKRAIGFLQSPGVVNVSARISSQIMTQAVKDGQMVKAGDLLFTLDDRALKAALASDQANLARDQATAQNARTAADRARDLLKKQAGTQQAYDDAQAALNVANATIQADQAAIQAAEVQLSYATITAPISGRLGAIQVTPGNLVSTGGSNSTSSTLVTITETDPLQVSFSLPESDLPLIREAVAGSTPAPVRIFNHSSDQPIAQGVLDFVDSTVDQASGTIAVRASLPNTDQKLWPGQYVDVELDAGQLKDVVGVPTVALQVGQQGPYVYVVKDDSTLDLRNVTVALSEGESSAVSAGLKAGEQVVTDGQIRLKPGMKVTAIPDKDSGGQGAGKPAAGGTAGGADKPATEASAQ